LEKNEKVERIIEIRNVSKQFDGITVVDDVNLSVRRGEFVTLLGPSGCGKTTTLRMIAGFDTPDSGRIFLNGQDITDTPPHLRQVNTVFQRYALFPHMDVYGNIAFGLRMKRIPDGTRTDKKGAVTPAFRKFTAEEIDGKVKRALKMVGLDDYGHRDVNSLSGGQMQRVAIARAVVNEPQVLLLDEPLGALDLKMRKDMQIELMGMHKNLGITFIYVTHDQEEALTMSDTVVVMRDGAIQQTGSPKKVYDEPANAFVADFIGESNIFTGTFIEDYKVDIFGHPLACVDKGFAKGSQVDIVVRPEDIYITDGADGLGVIPGKVISCIFKGMHYEMTVLADGYEFLVQNVKSAPEGADVRLLIAPDAIHIMKKQRTVNEFDGVISGEDEVTFLETAFPCVSAGFAEDDPVTVRVDFNKVRLTDDPSDGIMEGVVADALYKGTYYVVQVRTEYDEDFFVDTPEEWDIGDKVGIVIAPENLRLEKKAPPVADAAE
jgi:spermidine/putrescine transport system ATP-binding protein